MGAETESGNGNLLLFIDRVDFVSLPVKLTELYKPTQDLAASMPLLPNPFYHIHVGPY